MVRPQGRALGETHSPKGRQPLITSGSVLSCWSQMPKLKPSPDSYCLHDLWLDPIQPLLCKTNTLQHCCEDNCVNTHEALKRLPGTLPPFGQCQLLSNTSLPYRLFSCASRYRLLGCLDSTYQKLKVMNTFRLSLNMHLLLNNISSWSWARVFQRHIPRNGLLT